MASCNGASNTIGNLAAALAKAQGESTNPEKSRLVGNPSRQRYEAKLKDVPLCLAVEWPRHRAASFGSARNCHHADDRHRSGRRHRQSYYGAGACFRRMDRVGLAGVCRRETATPHRMGMALTYARRYSLFALVGIAGEDDLDAPDLIAPVNPAPSEDAPDDKASSNGRLNGCQRGGVPSVSPRRDAKMQSPKQSLGVEASAELRDRLIAELSRITSSDDAGLWAPPLSWREEQADHR